MFSITDYIRHNRDRFGQKRLISKCDEEHVPGICDNCGPLHLLYDKTIGFGPALRRRFWNRNLWLVIRQHKTQSTQTEVFTGSTKGGTSLWSATLRRRIFARKSGFFQKTRPQSPLQQSAPLFLPEKRTQWALSLPSAPF